MGDYTYKIIHLHRTCNSWANVQCTLVCHNKACNELRNIFEFKLSLGELSKKHTEKIILKCHCFREETFLGVLTFNTLLTVADIATTFEGNFKKF